MRANRAAFGRGQSRGYWMTESSEAGRRGSRVDRPGCLAVAQTADVKARAPRPLFVPAASGELLAYLGVTPRLTSAQTGGACAIFESTFEPGDANRLHVHGREDEIAYVLDGVLEVRTLAETRALEAGGIAHLPRGLAHGLRNPSGSASRYLFIAVPGGLDRWFDAVTEAHRDGELDDARFEALSLDFDLRWLE